MKSRTIVSAVLISAFLSVVGGGLVYAKQRPEGENDIGKSLSLAKISLIDAVGQAEAHAGGKATKAELESDHGVTAFEIEVVTAQNQVFDVKVDARDGKVLSSEVDKADDVDREDERDNKREDKREDKRS